MSKQDQTIYLIQFLLICLISSAFSQNETTTASPAPDAATTGAVKTKIDIFQNDICLKKCRCKSVGATNELDCTRNLTGVWFTTDEWASLQNGDKIFETIILEHNNLSFVPNLPEYPVKNLYLGFNQITKINESAFANLTNLTRLDLSHNLITSKALTRDVFKGLYRPDEDTPLDLLKDLNLGHNELHTLSESVFQHIPHLENLTLSQNVFGMINTPTEIAISSLLSLKNLDLSYMELKELDETILHALNKLETLIIVGNLFDSLPDGLEWAQNIQSLSIDDNPIVELGGDEVFPKMMNLRSLSISYMPYLTHIGNGTFRNLQNLTILYMSDNEALVSIDSEAFPTEATNLKELYLNNNKLSIVERSWFKRWDKIEIIDLRFNIWACNCTNKWMIETLVPGINATKPNFLRNVDCATPETVKNIPILQLATENHIFTCESSDYILAWVLVLLLLLIPLTIGGFILYRRRVLCFRNRLRRNSERAMYSRASFTDDYHT